MTAGKVENSAIRVDVSRDRLEATLFLRADGHYDGVTELGVFDALQQAGVAVAEDVRKQVRELIVQVRQGDIPSEPVLVARGTPATDPIDGRLEWDDALAQTDAPVDDEVVVNFYERHKIVAVENGARIGAIVPGRPGKPGVDVYGKTLPPRRPPIQIRLGEYVTLDNDGRTVRAAAAGQVVLSRGKLSVRTVLDVKNVDFETGNIDSASDVLVHGLVKDLFIVRSKQNVTVRGMVESAYIFAEGDVTIFGGVKGRGKGVIEAGGDISVKFLDSVYVVCGGEVEVAKEVIDNVILARGSLKAGHGTIIGGWHAAFGSVHAKAIGSPAGVKTVVGAGFDPQAHAKVFDLNDRIDKTREVVEKIRKNVEPLMQNLKRLSAEQREKATELMYRADDLDAAIQKLQDEKETRLGGLPDLQAAEIAVSARIFPNTHLILGNRIIAVREEIKGPVRIMIRKIDGVSEVVLVNKLSGSSRILPAQQIGKDALVIPPKPEIAQPAGKKENAEQEPASPAQEPPATGP